MAIRSSRNALVIAAILFVSSTTVFAQPRAIYQQTQYKGQEIGKLTGDVLRMDDYLSVFMVTPDGIVLVEPIGTEFATWLKGELASRSGAGSVYASTAIITGTTDPARRRTPTPLASSVTRR